MNKVTNFDQFTETLKDGMTIMIGGFNGICAPLKLIDKLVESGVKDLTVISVTCGHPGGAFDIAPLFVNKQIKKIITTHIGTSPEAQKLYREGGIDVEYLPMGIWIEMIRAGGYGLGGVVSPVIVGNEEEAGKTVVDFNGGKYVLERPLRADVAIIKAWRADRMGNLQYRGAGTCTNSTMVTAADTTFVEVNEIVEIGELDPNMVGTPGAFVNYVVQGYPFDVQEEIYEELWGTRGQFDEGKAPDPNDEREIIARRAALELENDTIVNLGIGMPTAAANYTPEGVNVVCHGENGILGYGKKPVAGKQDSDVYNAGAQPVTLVKGTSYFDLPTSFAIIRGGHVDTTILGTLEVDQEGNLANWALEMAPGKLFPGMGGAMELVQGAQKVVVVMKHTDKKGNPKILKKCSLPLTGKAVADVIISEKAVFHVTEQGLVLKEIYPGYTVEDIRNMTDAEFTVAEDLCEYQTAIK